MSRFEHKFPHGRATWLREQVLAAIAEAYDENCRRYAEEIGDNATTFGVTLFHNICFFLEQRLEGVGGVEIRRPSNAFVIEIDGYFLHVYKAPPGAATMHAMRFDQSDVRLELVRENTDQLSLEFIEESAPIDEPRHLVVVHFGDPIDGLERVEVGAPIASGVNGFAWAWSEVLSDQPVERRAEDEGAPVEHDEPKAVPDFGLTLIDTQAEERDEMQGGDAS